jgi:hypothetical protein
MLIGLFVTCIVLTLSPHAGKAESRAPALTKAPAHGEPRESTPPYRSEDLYSLRARRRFAAYLRLRLLEMREAGLERAADAVERRLPADALVP